MPITFQGTTIKTLVGNVVIASSLTPAPLPATLADTLSRTCESV